MRDTRCVSVTDCPALGRGRQLRDGVVGPARYEVVWTTFPADRAARCPLQACFSRTPTLGSIDEPTQNEVIAEDWVTLQDLLGQHAWNEQLGRYRSPYVFRGLSNADYTLEAAITRFGGETGRWELEGHLLRNFLKYAQQDIEISESPYYRLAIAQHHGLPTRLIDWTHSPTVAAFFATGGRADTDGMIWAVDYGYVRNQRPAGEYRVVHGPSDEFY